MYTDVDPVLELLLTRVALFNMHRSNDKEELWFSVDCYPKYPLTIKGIAFRRGSNILATYGAALSVDYIDKTYYLRDACVYSSCHTYSFLQVISWNVRLDI